MLTALLLPNARLSARDSLRRLLFQPSTVYDTRVDHWRHHLQRLFARADEPIAIIIGYLTAADHVTMPLPMVRDTMAVSRYDTPPLYRPGFNVDYTRGHSLSCADSIPITLRWHAASSSLQYLYDTRTSLTIEWPLQRPQPSQPTHMIPDTGISRHQRVTLYDDGTCWIYNHMCMSVCACSRALARTRPA